ncbi:TetR/AcrR family transcriptional regulator [Parvibaculum sp.]|uniref:TetR/AcrR family transcriptional regulator n=1 Tax=Parvibaculum sp. TaxID=2024848 RepID=UPI0025EDAC64|nr:TetR/AcrR family transcriptional regulator [Parvibaculum sp.]
MVTNRKTAAITLPARDRAGRERAVLDAIGRIILRDGLSGVGVNALAREAGVDKVLIYRYFGDLDGVYAAFAERGDFWWTVDEILGDPRPDPKAMTHAELLKCVLRRHGEGIRKRPVTLAVIAAEPANRTALVVALEEVRERRSLELAAWISERYPAPEGVDVTAIGMIAGAAIDYLAGRARNIRVYGGIEIKTDKNWERIYSAIDQMIDGMFPPSTRKARR